MISFALTEEQESVRAAMREFAEQAMRPAARAYDEASATPDSFLQQAWELGLTATQIAEEHGGYGSPRSPLTNAIVLEELACGDASLALAATAASAFAYAVADQGTAEQKRQYLPGLCGERYSVAALAVSEPAPNFDIANMRTTAELKNGGFVLNGRKCFVPMGDRAGHFLAIARNNSRLGAFIVPRDAAGLKIVAPEKNLGLKPLTTAAVELDGVAVPASSLLGGESGVDVQRILNQSRVAAAAILTGLSRAVLEYCVPYAKERIAFGEAIAKKQSIAFRLAEMHMEVECMRWMTWKAASQLEQGLDATKAAHLARQYAAEKAMWISDNGIQVLGGHGFIREHPVEMWYRNARTLGVLEGVGSI
jgi:alkylation response protein AidB-like acyl-CoA dehydrogenase